MTRKISPTFAFPWIVQDNEILLVTTVIWRKHSSVPEVSYGGSSVSR